MTKREGEGGGGEEEEEEEEEEERGERTHRCVSRIFLSQLAVPLATVRASFPPSVPRATFFGANERKKTRERERKIQDGQPRPQKPRNDICSFLRACVVVRFANDVCSRRYRRVVVDVIIIIIIIIIIIVVSECANIIMHDSGAPDRARRRKKAAAAAGFLRSVFIRSSDGPLLR